MADIKLKREPIVRFQPHGKLELVHDYIYGTFKEIVEYCCWSGGCDIGDTLTQKYDPEIFIKKPNLRLDLVNWNLYDVDTNTHFRNDGFILENWYIVSKQYIDDDEGDEDDRKRNRP
jgi:hypothetical protein